VGRGQERLGEELVCGRPGHLRFDSCRPVCGGRRIALGSLAPEQRGTLKVGGNYVHASSVARDCWNSVQKLWEQCAQRVALVELARFAQSPEAIELRARPLAMALERHLLQPGGFQNGARLRKTALHRRDSFELFFADAGKRGQVSIECAEFATGAVAAFSQLHPGCAAAFVENLERAPFGLVCRASGGMRANR
jgi:hypothetical protein